MSDLLRWELHGQEDLMRTFERMTEVLSPDQVEPLYKKGAQVIAREARKNAPVRKQQAHGRGGGGATKAPGVLKRAIVQRGLRRLGPRSPAPTIAAIDRKKAPHAHLVNDGTRFRRVSPPRWAYLGGRPVIIDNTGRMPANKFFPDAVRAKQQHAINVVERGVMQILEDSMR